MTNASTGNVPLNGQCDEGFDRLRAAFVHNFDQHGEIGARVAVFKDGNPVVDLWGGFRDEQRTTPWRDDDLVCCMSVSKGITALAAHMLADRGLLDYDTAVATYWPEFAQQGKELITVRQVLSHQASLGIIEDAQPGDSLDWDLFTAKIAAQQPNWPPGTNQTYHSLTFGFLVGEIVRRIDGRAIDRFVDEEIAQPLDAQFKLVCSDEDLAHVVPHIPNPNNELMNGGLFNEETARLFQGAPANFAPGSLEGLKWLNPSGGGVSHARGLANIFAPLACEGRWKGGQFLKSATIDRMVEQQWHKKDYLFGNGFRVALGLLLNEPFNDFGREGNFGTAGAGGFVVFADPHARISFAYTPNRYTSGYGLGNECGNLVAALYECVS